MQSRRKEGIWQPTCLTPGALPFACGFDDQHTIKGKGPGNKVEMWKQENENEPLKKKLNKKRRDGNYSCLVPVTGPQFHAMLLHHPWE